MERSASKAERLLQLERLLLAFPEGLRKAEIARRLGVHRATAARYVDEISRRVPVWEADQYFGIRHEDYRVNVRLNVHEAMALHMAARLMATSTDKHNPHAAAALRKLSQALQTVAPLVSAHLVASAAVMDDKARRRDPLYLEVLETLTRAWAEGRKVRLGYQKAPEGPVTVCRFAPYFLEPYALGHTTYVIGWRDDPPGERTLKLERIRHIELLAERYEVPASFDALGKLSNAWGIWYTGTDPQEVVLRFQACVAGRVVETQWQPGERTAVQPDGSLVWRAWVAEPTEMKPWIRGWGPDCEVLTPGWLREEIAEEMRRAAALYAG